MSYTQNTWNRLKNITVEKLMKALEKDGWEKENPKSARIPKVMNNGEVRRVVIHRHPGKIYCLSFSKDFYVILDGQVKT